MPEHVPAVDRAPAHSSLPARHPELEVAEFETEVVVFDHRSSQVHHLVGLDALVFDACDGATSVEALVAEMAGALDVRRIDLLRQINASLNEMTALGLFVGSPPPPPPCSGCVQPEHGDPRRWWRLRRRAV